LPSGFSRQCLQDQGDRICEERPAITIEFFAEMNNLAIHDGDLTDPDNPKETWNYVKKTDRDESAVPRACCDTVNRGVLMAMARSST
jgi:hypothetical protein